MSALSPIDTLISALAQAHLQPGAFNQYAPGHPDNAIRRANLGLYLRAMQRRKPTVLLLLEAPGYRGCRLTGLPVTSRRILLEGCKALDMFGREAGFRDVGDAGFERVYGEQSATIVWGALAEMRALPLIWNAFPFHPHKAGNPLSNRKPRAAELALGAEYTRRLLTIWTFAQIIAVGNVAHELLRRQGVACHKVRHPANGGKNDFVAGLRALLTVA
ncbi:MAG: uracil-DNA glycosylase [Chloroflexi bacterium]|nr:uracil-DNA glycosylase [Chloroflexota bacterium]MCY4247576.1 uracil-DNA glycosylase [Chloroflexota bacterium]